MTRLSEFIMESFFYSADVVSALSKLRDSRRLEVLSVELTESYPESEQLSFLKPAPLNECMELAGSNVDIPCGVDARIQDVGQTFVLLAHPLLRVMSHVADSKTPLDRKEIAAGLADVAKAMIIGTHKAEVARCELLGSTRWTNTEAPRKTSHAEQRRRTWKRPYVAAPSEHSYSHNSHSNPGEHLHSPAEARQLGI